MPVYSMTGYASVQHSPLAADGETPANAAPTARLGLEIRSVNSRFLDISLRLSDELRPAEPALRELIGARIKRGKVEVRAWIEGRSDHALRQPSMAELQKLIGVQDHVLSWMPQSRPLSVAEVLANVAALAAGAHAA